MKKLLGRLVGLAAAAGAGYYIYDKFVKDDRMMIEVSEITSSDIIEMFKGMEFNIITSSNNRVLHITKVDKSEAIQARLEDDDSLKIEYYGNHEPSHVFVTVLSNDKSTIDEEARQQFRNCLGSIGVTENRFTKFVKEVLDHPDLLDGSM